MEDSRSERAMRFAEIHYLARIKAKRSQDYMAMELGVNKKTVQNWEKGISSPSFFQSLEWFRALRVNPFPYYLSVIHHDKLGGIKATDDDKKTEEAFKALIDDISINDKRAFLYLYCGEHGSDPYSVVQLLLAHLHLPIKERLEDATGVLQKYRLEKQMGNLICNDYIQPDVEALQEAINKAQESTLNKEFGYNNLKTFR